MRDHLFRHLIALWILVGMGASPAIASTPRLSVITPRGVQRGGEYQLRFSGNRLGDTRQVLLYDEGVEVVEFKQVDGNNVDVKIKVAADCRLGEHIAQLRTVRGVSDFRSFYIGAMVEAAEAEPNNSLENAQAIESNRTINGVITSEDVDLYKIQCKKGERLSIEIEAMRLGALVDPFVSVLNSEKFEIAVSDDSQLHRQDSLISLQVPADGEYYVLVREASYGGSPGSRYRLHVGSFPRPVVAFPAGAPANTTAEIQFLGDALGAMEKQVEVPEAFGFRNGLFVEDEQGVAPSPVKFRISDLENHFETEPNDDRKKVTEIFDVPAAFNGIISSPKDVDYFRFKADKGEVFEIECFARRIGSGLDPLINIYTSKGKRLAGDDDARRPDSYLRFTAPETGDFLLRLRDHLHRGQPDFVYRFEITKVKPRLSIEIPRVDRYSQLRQQISVPRGNRFATLIRANRENFGGPITLGNADWPEGITVESKPMVPNLNMMPVVFTASDDAPLAGKLLDLQASHADPAKNISGGFRNFADFALGEPNNTMYYGASVERLACAVVESLPFKIDIVQPKAPLVRGGSLYLKIVATREEGFDKPIKLQFPFRPPGVGTKPQVQIKKGESEARYPLNANGNAQIGTWPVYVIGEADVGGPAWASSQLAELKITEPIVTAEMNRTACHRGESTTIFCKLNHHREFEGEATAELLGIPPNITIPKLKFTKETKELSFQVATNDKSPIGKHRGLFCRLTIVENGEPVVSTAARSELRINKPKPSSKPADSKQVVKEAKPKAKPKSRLEQLRDAKASKPPH